MPARKSPAAWKQNLPPTLRTQQCFSWTAKRPQGLGSCVAYRACDFASITPCKAETCPAMIGLGRCFFLIAPLLVILLLVCPPSMSLASSNSNGNDVAVIGCGVLGTSLCKQLMESPDFSSQTSAYAACVVVFPQLSQRCLISSCSFLFVTVTGVTKTSSRHESILEQVGDNERFSVKTADEIQDHKFRNVVFCAPPSGFDDYPAAVKDAVTNVWDKSLGGVFVFTSSGGM